MKTFLKELAQREGQTSQVNYKNLEETMNHVIDILTLGTVLNCKEVTEFLAAIEKRFYKITQMHSNSIGLIIHINPEEREQAELTMLDHLAKLEALKLKQAAKAKKKTTKKSKK